VIKVSLAGRCPCQNCVRDGGEPSDWWFVAVSSGLGLPHASCLSLGGVFF
jgi:hypothetical protein